MSEVKQDARESVPSSNMELPGFGYRDLLDAFEASPMPQVLLRTDDPTFTIVAVSNAYIRVTGCQRSQLLGHGIFQMFPDNPADANANGAGALLSSLRRVVATKVDDHLPQQRYDVERREDQDGTFRERYWNAANTPILRSDGSVGYVLHTAQEVTEKVIAHKTATQAPASALHAPSTQPNELNMRAAQRAGRIGSFEWFLKENRAYFTPELEALYGLKEGTLKPGFEEWSRWVVPEDYQRVVAEIRTCLANGEAECTYEFRAARPDGTTRWLRGQAQLFYDQDGFPDRMIGVNIDIEAQKRAELHTRQTEQQLRAIFDGTYEYIWLLSPDGTMLQANRASLEFGGGNRPMPTGQPFWNTIWFAGTPGAPEKIREAVEGARNGESLYFELNLNCPTGGSLIFDVSLHPVKNEHGEVVLIVPEACDISDRKAAELQVRQQWLEFDRALSNIPDFIYTFDLEGRVTYANAALLSLWQTSLESARGKTFFDLDYPAVLATQLHAEMAQVISTRQLLRNETPFTGPDGETRHYEYIFVPVLDAEGNVKSVAGATRDMTERAKAKEYIQDDRRRWRDLLQQTPAAIAILKGPEYLVEWVNDPYVQLVGRPAEQIVGRSVSAAAPQTEGPHLLALLDQVYQTGKPASGSELRVNVRSEAENRTVYVNYVFLANRDAAGCIDGIFMHITDVSDMVLSRLQLEEGERQFRTLAESIPHLAWMADESGYIFWYNRRWYEYTGTTFAQMEGWQWQTVHDPKVLPDVISRWKTAIDHGDPFEMTFPLKRADNEFRSFLTRVEPLKDHHGKVVRWFGTNTDITQQQETEDQLRRMNRELEEFAFVASHDLQEPLRMVNIYTQLLLKKLKDDGNSYDQYATFVRQGVDRMETLLHDLLSFSRSVHTEPLEHGNADLQASLSEALSVLRPRIQETGALIHAEPLPETRGETAQMAHVFQNLLSNALKYRKPQVPPQIHISARLEEQEWVISVSDNGIGFAPQYAEHIFGLFKRLYKHEYPGTGLGLAICKRIVERYGGRIWASSSLGEGATFSFTLPVSHG